MKLTEKEQNLQNRAIKVGQVRNRAEAEILEIVQEVFSTKLYKKLGLTLHAYTVTTFKLDDPIANCFNSVAKKSLEVPELLIAVTDQSLTLWKACRIVSVLTPENASELIEFAKANSSRCIEKEVARLNPKGKGQDRVRILSDKFAQIKRTISHKGVANLNRAESILVQKGKTGSSGELLELIIEDYLERHDPVLKAERAMKRKMKREQARAAANSSVPNTNESTEAEFSEAAAKASSATRLSAASSELRFRILVFPKARPIGRARKARLKGRAHVSGAAMDGGVSGKSEPDAIHDLGESQTNPKALPMTEL
jgi:hypothetical protein